MDFKKFDKIQQEISQVRTEANKLKTELKIAYEYQEDAYSKLKFADQQVGNKQAEYHQILIELNNKIEEMKNTFQKEADLLNVC